MPAVLDKGEKRFCDFNHLGRDPLSDSRFTFNSVAKPIILRQRRELILKTWH